MMRVHFGGRIFELGPVSDEVREKIMIEKNLETLKKWHKLVAKAESMDEFLKAM